MRRLIVLLLVAAAAIAAVPTTAGSLGKFLGMRVTLASHVEPLTFTIEIDAFSPSPVECDPGTIEVTSVEIGSTIVTPVSVTEDPTDPNSATIVLPSDTAPGTMTVMATCTNDEEEATYTALGERAWAAIAVTKTVNGPVPDDATFTVHVDCALAREAGVAGALTQLAVDLPYGPTGGIKYVYFDAEADCTITEPNDGGALTTTITPGEVVVTDAISYPVTVTNEFPVVVSPTFTG